MTAPSPIPLARPDDEDQLVDLLRERHEEEGLGSFDEGKVRATVRRGISRDWSCIGVIRGRFNIEASVGIYLNSWWYSNDDILSDLWCYARAAYRKSAHARTLLSFAKWTALELNRPFVATHFLNADTTKRVISLQKEVGPPRGSIYIFDPAHPEPPQEPGRNREIKNVLTGRRPRLSLEQVAR